MIEKVEKFEQLVCQNCGGIIRGFLGIHDREDYVEIWCNCECGFVCPLAFMKTDLTKEEEKKSYVG